MMSAECERNLERLSPLLDNELDEPTAVEVRGHLAKCPPCEVARCRLERLEVISVRILRAAPPIASAEWTTCWQRIQPARARIVPMSGVRRERALKRSLAAFALAAALLVCATLALPLLVHDAGPAHHPPGGEQALLSPPHLDEYLRISSKRGANRAEVLELDGDMNNYAIGVDYPSSDWGDAVVITISKID